MLAYVTVACELIDLKSDLMMVSGHFPKHPLGHSPPPR